MPEHYATIQLRHQKRLCKISNLFLLLQMQFHENNIYHVYNQGNNKQQIFFSNENYLYFLKSYRNLVMPYADTLAYCLMPNHFHFLINTNAISVQEKRVGSLVLSQLSNGIRILLSSYAAAINKQQNTTGSLFRQKTKAKLIESQNGNYGLVAFHYIHQNPLASNLVKTLDEWEFSSYKDYAGKRNVTHCNMQLAKELIDVNWNNFEKESIAMLKNKEEVKGIF